MRKAAILTALLLVLSIGGVCVAASGVYEARDQVVLTETVVYGDRAAANGLTVELNITCADHLFWDTTCTLDAQIQTRTEYSFSALEARQKAPGQYKGVYLYSDVDGGLDMWEDDPTGLNRAYRELYDSLKPGEEKSVTVYVKDYLDYYPLTVELDFPEVAYRLSTEELAGYLNAESFTGPPAYYAAQALLEYFKIPILPEEVRTITVSKGNDDRDVHVGAATSRGEEGDYFELSVCSALTDDACYFTFDAHSRQGKLVDLHEIPGGYGIYRLPYQADEVDADALEMVYSLDPEIKLLGLFANEDQTKLLLHAVENGKYILTVIDLDDMTTLQKLEIAEWPEDQYWQLYSGDGCMAVLLSREQELAVIAETDDGDYELWYMGDAWPDELGGFPFRWEPVLAFDGERLAFVGFLSDEYGNHYYYTCDFALAVYEPSGLAYYGEYGNSLNTSGNYTCRGCDYDPLTVSWAASD